MRLRDVIALVAALGLHVGLAVVLARVRPSETVRKPRPVEVDVRHRPPPPEPPPLTPPTPPEPPPEPKEPPKTTAKPRTVPTRPRSSPPPAQEPPPPSKEPPPPSYGVSMDSTTDAPGSVAAPTGDTTMAAPGKSAPQRREPAPAPTGAGRRGPASDLDVSQLPDVDTEACGRSVKYPSEAEELGIEGHVLLRVELDETGKVVNVSVVRGLGHGLDQAAMTALRRSCRFTPAVAKDGTRVPYVIQRYDFNFELPR